MEYLDHKAVLDALPNRSNDSHKGDYGKILLLCGSKGYTGAAALSAMGALRIGAGLVYLAVPESIYQIEAVKLLEPIVLSLPDDEGHVSVRAQTDILHLLDGKDAVLIGPGLGCSAGVFAAIKLVLENYDGPVVLDADGINAITQHKYLLRERTAPTILTPHAGEFARLTNTVCTDRIAQAREFAENFGCIMLLKGNRTVITDGQTVYINTTGNPGMAVGGCGDVLAGMITGLLGQGLEPLKAAACAAWLHGASGDICAQEIGQYGMLPSDMVKVLPRLLK